MFSEEVDTQRDISWLHFSVLTKLKKMVILIACFPKRRLCDIGELKMTIGNSNATIDDDTGELHEDCEKLALSMFFSSQQLSDLKKKGSHWKRFCHELICQRRKSKTNLGTNVSKSSRTCKTERD